MEKNRFRCHFSVIFENTAAFGVFLILVLFGQIQNVIEFTSGTKKEDFWKVLIGLIVVLVITIVLFAYQWMVWRKTYIIVEDQAIVVQRLTLNMKENTYGIKNISNVNLEQNLFEMVMGTYKIKIDTNSRTTADKTDIKIILAKDKAIEFKNFVMTQMRGEQKERTQDLRAEDLKAEDYDVKYEIGDLVRHSVFATPLFVIFCFFGVCILIVIGLAQAKFGNELLDFAKGALGGYLAIGLAIVGTLGTTVKNFVKFYDFRVKRFEDRLLIGYGLLKKRNYEIPINMINAIKINQSSLSRIFKRYSLEIVNIGVGDEKDEGSFLILTSKKEEFERVLCKVLPEFASTTDEQIRRQPKRVWKLIVFKTVLVTLFGGGFLLGALKLEVPQSALIPMICGVAAMVVVTIVSSVFHFRTVGLCIGEDYLGIAQGIFKKITTLIKYDKIQLIEIKQGPISKKMGLAHGIVFILASIRSSICPFAYIEVDQCDEIVKKMKGKLN